MDRFVVICNSMFHLIGLLKGSELGCSAAVASLYRAMQSSCF